MRWPGARRIGYLVALVVAGDAPDPGVVVAAPTDLHTGMVFIPGGPLRMGSDAPDANPNERPVHLVRVPAFWLDKTEVTVAAYAACVRGGTCQEPDAFGDKRGDFHVFCNWRHPQHRDNHPVNCVDFVQAKAYCHWAGKRLPTESEWELAARGGEDRKYPWGNQPPDATRLNACEPACQKNLAAKRFFATPPMYPADDGWPETAPVGSFPAGASKHGALDLAGNVWEWTDSLYASYDGKVHEDKRVLRGGSWGGGDPRTERTTNRFRLDPQSRAQFLGFRCAR
jgi:formylglycine-generating enzyme required for sulfatase activity